MIPAVRMSCEGMRRPVRMSSEGRQECWDFDKGMSSFRPMLLEQAHHWLHGAIDDIQCACFEVPVSGCKHAKACRLPVYRTHTPKEQNVVAVT